MVDMEPAQFGPVSYTHLVGGDVSRDIARLGLDEGQGSDGTAAQIVAHPAGALQQTGMQIEHVAGVSLTAGGAAQQQGNGTVCHGVLGKVRCV